MKRWIASHETLSVVAVVVAALLAVLVRAAAAIREAGEPLDGPTELDTLET